MAIANKQQVIELRVEDIAQLFHTLDPFPFRERDLDSIAEEYIVSWARELPSKQDIKIVVHFPNTDAQAKDASELSEAFVRHFSHRADILQRDLNELFRVGRRSLAIGIPPVDCVPCVGAPHERVLRRKAIRAHGGGKFLNSRVGRELAAS